VSVGFAFILTYPVPIRPVDTRTCPSSYDWELFAKSPKELVSWKVSLAPYPLVTYKSPLKSESLSGKFLEALCTKTYSVANPVELTFLSANISPSL